MGEIAFQSYSTSGYLLVQLVDATSNTPINTQTNTYPYNTAFNEVNNLVSDIIYTPNTNQTVKFRVVGGTVGLTAEQRGAGFSRASIVQINPTVTVNDGTSGTSGSSGISGTSGSSGSSGTSGSSGSSGTSGSSGSSGTSGSSGSSGTSGISGLSGTTGSWTVTPGTNNYSFTLSINSTYNLWVIGNIPNGIIVYNATVTISNSNVPVIGVQYAWNYIGAGSPILLTSIPVQIIGTAGAISTASPAVGTSTNTFVFGIQNTTGSNVTVDYGYLKIS